MIFLESLLHVERGIDPEKVPNLTENVTGPIDKVFEQHYLDSVVPEVLVEGSQPRTIHAKIPVGVRHGRSVFESLLLLPDRLFKRVMFRSGPNEV
jgi:hypothetical protein